MSEYKPKMEYRVNRLPKHMQEVTILYIEEGKLRSKFLQRVLENNFMGALLRADSKNEDHLCDWAEWLYSDIPSIMWGNEEVVEKWVEMGGLEGYKKDIQKKI